MSKLIIPCNWKQCCTCVRWGGERRPNDPFLNNVETDTNGKGKCYQGVFNQCDMPAQAHCDKWEQQYKK